MTETSKQSTEAVKCRSRAPDVPCLLEALNSYQIRYVITGSVAAQLYGVDLQPGDLDITPALDGQNLTRLAGLLVEIDAALPDGDEAGRWEVQPDGERKWIGRTATPEDHQRRARWRPDPEDVTSLDHLFYTRYGDLDVVPDLTGGYETLLKRATGMLVDGHQVWVVHVDELLEAPTVPRRKKEPSRVQRLREIQHTGVRPRTGVHSRMGVR